MAEQARHNGQGPAVLERREFLRLAAGTILTIFLPGCRHAPALTPSPSVDTGWVDTTPYRQAPPWRFGRSGRGDVNAWMVMLSAHVEYGVQEKYRGSFVQYFCTSANWDPNKQIEDIHSLLKEGIDVLVIDPMDTNVVAQGVSQAMEAGVPVILAASPLQNGPYVSWVAVDEEERGKDCAEWLCQTISGGHVWVLGSEPAAGDSQSWLRAVQRTLRVRGNVQSTTTSCTWVATAARQATAALLESREPVAGVIVQNGILGQGVVQAFVEHGRDIPPIAGVDDQNGWLRLAHEHPMRFLALSGGANLGLRCVELATQILSGEPVPRRVSFPYLSFEDTELDRYFHPDLSDVYWAIHDLPDMWVQRMFKR